MKIKNKMLLLVIAFGLLTACNAKFDVKTKQEGEGTSISGNINLEGNMEQAEDYIKLAEKYYRNKDFNNAITNYNKAMEADPALKSTSAYLVNLGMAYDNVGNLDKAEYSFNKALKIAPENSDLFYKIGNHYEEKNDYDNAIDYYKKAIESKKDFEDAYMSLGNCYTKREELNLAIDTYKEAININDSSAKAYNNLGNAYYQKAEFEQAAEAYQKAIEFEPANSNARKMVKLANEKIVVKKNDQDSI